MNKLEIIIGSLQISINGTIVLVIPKDACAINSLSLKDATPIVYIFNKYLANNSPVFIQPLSSCVDSTNTPFTQSSFIAFAEANLGF
jgi:hypothetical protein